MKLRFTNSISGAFLSFCILSIGATGGLRAQNSASNSGQNSNLTVGQIIRNSSAITNKEIYVNGNLIEGKFLTAKHVSIDPTNAIKYEYETGVALDMDPLDNPQSMQFNINQNDLGELYKLLALYKSESGKGHTIVNLTRQRQLGKAADSFPVFRKYVVDDNLAGYTPAQATVEPPVINTKIKVADQSENSEVSGPTLSETTAGIIQENVNLSDLISLYPNPAQNFITVDLSSISGTQITIYNIQGKPVKTIESSQNLPQQKIDIAELPSGFYMMSVSSPSGQAVKKFSKIN